MGLWPSGPSLRAQTVIAYSLDDWSVDGTQGEKSWYYGYYNKTDDEANGDGVYQTDDFNYGSNVVSTDPTIGGWKTSTNHWNGGSWDLLYNNSPHPRSTGRGRSFTALAATLPPLPVSHLALVDIPVTLKKLVGNPTSRTV